jgi:hypothetical protein
MNMAPLQRDIPTTDSAVNVDDAQRYQERGVREALEALEQAKKQQEKEQP